MVWANLHCHSRFSWDCISKIKDMVKFVKEDGQTALAVTDHGNMNGAITLYKECKKQNIKPIIGCEFYICQDNKNSLEKNSENRKLNHLVVLAKNTTGYKNLLKLVSLSNGSDRFYYYPRIDKQILEEYGEGLIIINGHIGSSLSRIFFNPDGVELCNTIDECREYLDPDYKEYFQKEAQFYQDIWGDDFYCEVQLFDPEDLFQQSLGYFVSELADEFGYQLVGTPDAHYIVPEDQPYHKTFVCIKQSKKINLEPYSRYMDSGMYGLVTQEHAEKCYPARLISATQEIVDKVEDYDIMKKHAIPDFEADDKLELIREICENRMKELELTSEEYVERFEYELSVIKKGNLEGYFLIVRDYIEWAESKGIMTGIARGSSAGSLVSYLMNITKIDPLPYDLLFERFYSPDRAEAGQLPDIDTDFQASRRDEVIDYVKDKYGHDKVCGLITFGTLQGKGALKDVLRTYGACDFTTMNKITDCIPGKDKVSDKLAEFKKEMGTDSLLMYMLIKEPEELEIYCTYDVETKEFSGEFAEYFELAVGLEGAIRSDSVHPCAVLISNEPIDENAPLVRDKNSDDRICGYEKHEDVSLVKFDILAISALDKLDEVNKIIREIGIEV